jgi:cytosine/adenosine deaminase-related metal-dependent hydrolase
LVRIFAAVTDRRYSRKVIIRARVVVTMNGPPIGNGAVAIAGNQIVDVGSVNEVIARNSGPVLDLGEQALLPGLINAHCHLDYTCLRGKIPRQNSFTDWIRTINAEKAKLSADDYLVSIQEGFEEAKRFGTTTIANLEAFPELIAKIDAPIRTWWFAELIDVREPHRAKEIVDRALGSAKAAEHWGLAPHAPFTASANLYRYAVEVARREDVLLTTHLAESEEEMQMSFDLGGPLAAFLDSIGGDLYEYNGVTPVAHMLETCRLDSRWIVAHLNSVLESDLESLSGPTKCHVVHCPRSHSYFGHPPFRFERLRRLGFNICLGTDSLASNEDLSLFAEMRAFQKKEPQVPPKEILSMVTVNTALALGKSTILGRIRTNSGADMVAIPFYGSPKTLFEEIVAFDGDVMWSAINGEMPAGSHI